MKNFNIIIKIWFNDFIILISDEQFKKVLSYIEKGKTEGACCITGGERIGKKGYFVKPTIFADVKDDMVIAREEVCIKNFKFFLKLGLI